MSESRRALEERFERILGEHGAAISRLAYSYEAVAGIREELVQEIALAIWRALPHFRGECSERTFVFRIAHNRGLTHVRRCRPRSSRWMTWKRPTNRWIRVLIQMSSWLRQNNGSDLLGSSMLARRSQADDRSDARGFVAC